MKKRVLVCFSILVSFSLIGQDLTQTTPIKVAEDLGNHHSQVEILGDNGIGVTWTDASEKAIYFTKHNGVDGFETPIQLNPEGLDVQSYAWSGPDMAIEGDNLYVVFRSDGYETGGIYLVKSDNNGESFGDTVRVDQPSDGFGQYPDVAVLNDTVYVTFMDHDAGGANPAYVVARSVDGGLTFEPAVLAAALLPGESCDCCPPEIIVNEEVLLLFFRNNDEDIRDIKAVQSFDSGGSFGDWISVDDHNWFIAACPSSGPDARFIGTDKIAAAYKTEVDGSGKVFLNIYDLASDESIDLIEIYATEGLAAALNYPQLAYEDDLMGMVWEDVTMGTSIDVYFNYSSTASVNFDPDEAINLTAEVGAQSKPDIALRNGIFQVVYANGIDGDLYYLQIGEPNAIDEVGSELTFQAYFSNSGEVLSLEGPDLFGADIEVVDLNGRVIWSQTAEENQLKLNASNWASGAYVITCRKGMKSLAQKLVRE